MSLFNVGLGGIQNQSNKREISMIGSKSARRVVSTGRSIPLNKQQKLSDSDFIYFLVSCRN